jgi:hypothetical protein
MRLHWLLVSLCVSCATNACAQGLQSGNDMIQACHVAVADDPDPRTGEIAVMAGLCMGRIEALSWAAPLLADNSLRSCRPETATLVEAAKVVVAYLDKIPSRLHEHFNALELEALAHAWPCSHH